MKLLAVSLARVSVFTDIYEWNPQNRISFREFTQAFVERYGFMKWPQTVEEFDLQKGVVFQLGMLGNQSIDSVTMFTKGVVIDTRSSTEDGERFILDAAEWAGQFFGTERDPQRISRKFFLSELSFYSEKPLDLLNTKLRDFAARLGEAVSRYAHEPHTFEPTGIIFSSDPPTRLGTLHLRIDRLAGSPFWENKYFSSAPLPTNEHLAFLADFESILQS